MIATGPREAAWIIESARDHEHALELARRRGSGEPLQYITGEAHFRRLTLKVGPGVLIPRPETEIVTERALERLPKKGVLVDIGTGSGAIALAIKDERRDAYVYATENEADALDWAWRNISALGLEVKLIDSDLFSHLPENLRANVDVVVSNPPYVATDDAGLLPVDVVAHEPHAALFAGPDGLDVIRSVASDAPGWLKSDAWLVLEIGEAQAAPVRELLSELGYRDIEIHDDLTGRPRIAEGRKP